MSAATDSDAPALRRAAEERMRANAGGRPPLREVDLLRLQHELEVHQIELEMQIDELRTARAEIQAGLERYTDLYEFAPAGYFNLKEDGTIRLANLTGSSLLGSERASLEGVRFGALVAEADRPTFNQFLADVFRTKGKASCELTLVRPGRPPICGLLEATLAPSAHECRVVLIDITERRSLESQLQHAQRILAISTVSAGVAHDINNTLTPIILGANLVMDHITDPEDREMMQVILTAAARGSSLVKQLLTFSRGEAGERVPVQVRYLIKEMATIIKETFPRDLILECDVAGELRPVSADPTQIHQVLMNLCINARDAMVGGGRLVISAKEVELTDADVKAHAPAKPGDYIAISVKDTGCGIPPENLGQIFEPFYTTKVREKGTGLGLSVVMGIVRNHSGVLMVASTPGEGTTFTVFLPAIPEPIPVMVQPTTEPPPVGRGELVLVVDDESMVSETVRMMLEFNGYTAITADNGISALAAFRLRRDEVRLVITDLMMPEMDGAALIHELHAEAPEVKVILFSGLLEPEKRAQIDADRVACILPKPCGGDRMLWAVARALGR